MEDFELKLPFSNMQVELLKLYSRNVSEEDLRVIKEFIALYFYEKMVAQADKVWDEKGWTDAYFERMTNEKMSQIYEPA